MIKDKKKWIQQEIPIVKKMVEEFRKPDKDNPIKQFQVKEKDGEKVCLHR